MAAMSAAIAATPAAAAGPVPPPAHADMESCAHLAVPPLEGRTSLRVALAFGASPSNSLSVAIGADADGDGGLSLREQSAEFGWDGGSWFIRRRSPYGWERYEWPGAEGRRFFEAALNLSGSGPRRLKLSADGEQLAALPAEDWLPREALDGGLIRVTARGAGVDGAAGAVPVTEGTVLIVR